MEKDIKYSTKFSKNEIELLKLTRKLSRSENTKYYTREGIIKLHKEFKDSLTINEIRKDINRLFFEEFKHIEFSKREQFFKIAVKKFFEDIEAIKYQKKLQREGKLPSDEVLAEMDKTAKLMRAGVIKGIPHEEVMKMRDEMKKARREFDR